MMAFASDEVEMTAFKAAEDGNGYIVRLADRHGQGLTTTFTFDGQTFPVVIGPSDVVTLRLVQVNGAWQTSECDMLERPNA